MKVNREDLLIKLETIAPGLSMEDSVEQCKCFVFDGIKAATFNDEIACTVDLDIGI